MSLNKESRNGLSSYEQLDIPQYRKFLKELQNRTEELWETVLCRGPVLNSSELLREHTLIREFLLEIEMMQKTFSHSSEHTLTHSEQRKAALTDFLQWANKVGIFHHFVEIVYVEDVDGFGLTSSGYAAVGSDLLKVPRKAIFSWDQARTSAFLNNSYIPNFRHAFDRDLIIRSMDNVALAMMLCCQKLIPESKWQPYIKMLPENFNTPLYFTTEQLQCLRPSPLFEESLLLYRNISRQFIHFLLEIIRSDQFRLRKKKSKEEMSVLQPLYTNSPLTAANFTFNLYRWSVACISTRINMIPSEILKDELGQPRMVPALIPFLDMANHSYTDDAFHEAVHFSDKFDCAEIIAVRDYKPFEPVNIFYGWRSSRDFLLHNGFVPLEKNIRDIYKLKIGLPKSKRENARMHLFQTLGFIIESTIFAFEIRIFEPYFHDSLFRFAQIYVLDEIPLTSEQVEEIVSSSDNIRKAWSFLHDRFALLHRAYGTVIDPLSAAYPAPPEFYKSSDSIRKSMIARLKLSEIEILQKAEDFCSKQLLKIA
uniref:protein-histidine N-methyltransferase n=1 Tax=Setaria digitata TaxID=48799 RepID=A0A915Q6M0_9BILA